MNERRAEVYALVRTVPFGRVVSYGQVGRALRSPLSGLLVGRMLWETPEGVPWWRVVGASGDLLTIKRSPELARLQAAHLGDEGVEVVEGRLEFRRYAYDLES